MKISNDTLQAHRNLENSLRNKYGYKGLRTVVIKETQQVAMETPNRDTAEELTEIFGEQGFSFFFNV